MASSPPLKHQASRSSPIHQVYSLALRHQVSKRTLRHQTWLAMHARNLKDLTALICPSDRSTWLGLSISSGTVSLSKRLADLAFPFHLTLWEKENFSLLVLDKAYFGPDGVICLSWLAKGS